MSLPSFSTQSELFSIAGLSTHLFAETDRYRLFAKLVYPPLARARRELEKLYCPENGRTAIEPVLMLGVSLLQDLDGVPDRQAVEMLRYHAGWNFALNRQLGDAVFHPTTLVNFRHRLEEHQQSALGFKTILDALLEAGLVSRQSRQRLDSTQMFGRVAKMSRLDCVRESLRLALQELEGAVAAEARPVFWIGLWERYVESQVDYRAGAETLSRKLVEAGTDAWQLLEWLRKAEPAEWAQGEKAQLLRRVFGEQFEVVAGQAAPLDKEKITVVAGEAPMTAPKQKPGAVEEAARPPGADSVPCHDPGPRDGQCGGGYQRPIGVGRTGRSSDSTQRQRAAELGPGAKPARTGRDLRRQRRGPEEEGACRLQDTSGRDGERSGAGSRGADAQFHCGDCDACGLPER